MTQAYLDQHQTYRKRRNFRIKIYFGGLILILFLISILYILVYSPIFQIREFKIAGAQRLNNEEVLKILTPAILNTKTAYFLGIKNLFIWNEKKPDVSRSALLEANIKREWLGQAVIIGIKERERLAIWCRTNSPCYWIDKNGMAFEEAPETEGSLILIVRDNSPEILNQGGVVAESRFVENLSAILNGILELKIPAKKIIFDKRLQEVRVESYFGPDYFFSIRFNPKLNLESLESLEEKNDLKRVSYFDLRVENRIFYKR